MSIITKLYGKLGTGSPISGENRIARYLARKLLSDMDKTISDKSYSPAPFVQYERHFGHSPLHVERFQNFVAEYGILRKLLAVDFFKALPAYAAEPIANLFRRVLYTDNVQRSIENRPQFHGRLKYIENPDLIERAEAIPVAPKDAIKSKAAKPSKVRQAIFRGPAKLKPVAAANKPSRYDLAEPSSIIDRLVDDVLAGLDDPAKAVEPERLIKSIQATAMYSRHGADLPRLLSAYEMAFGEDDEALGELDNMLVSLPPESRPTGRWLDDIYFNDRILVASLFRRLEKRGGAFADWLKRTELSDKIIIGSQDDVAQLTEAGDVEVEEAQLFRKIIGGEISRLDAPIVDAESDYVILSDQSLRKAGWYKSVGGADWILTEAIRSRVYSDVIDSCKSEKAFSALSPTFQMFAAAASAYLGCPVSKKLAKQFPAIPAEVTMVSGKRVPAIKAEAEKILFRREIAAPQESPRAYWFELQRRIMDNDDAAFAAAARNLDKIYGEQRLNLIRDRSISFDTFLITELPRILSRANKLVLWPELSTQTNIAFAYSAIETGNAPILQRIIGELQSRKDMARNLYIPMMQSYQINGFHNLDIFLANTSHTDIDIKPVFTHFKPKEKVLALIEGPAQLKELRNLAGKPAELHCVPVQPIQVSKVPGFATVTQVDDVIPTYGEIDAKLSTQVDDIISKYIKNTQDHLRKNGFDGTLVDCVEVAHANLFFPAYRDMLSLHIAQSYVEKAGDYDRVLVLLHNGLSYAPLLDKLIDKLGKDRVHISIRNDRRDVSISALNEIRRINDLPPVGRERPYEKDWAKGLKTWLKETRTAYNSEPVSGRRKPYAVACFEHINGYGDSYKALVNENLKHGDVELCISVANAELQNFIDEGGFEQPLDGETAQNRGEMRQFAVHARPDPATNWVPGLSKELEDMLARARSPLFPQWRHMFAKNITAYMAQRLPRIFDAMVYFERRFDKKLPTHIMTGPNQHIVSRVASYIGRSRGVRVYDFLILANTDHPRYRPPVADIAYLYDDWYKEIYRSFFKMKASQFRQSGPLFRYADRLKTDMDGYEKTPGLRDIVLFSQSANFESTKTMLEAICAEIAEREDIALTVKLHPHESPANVGRFMEIAKANGVAKNLEVIHKGDAVALVNMADLVVQSFSNVGLDAFLLGNSVITYKPPTNLTSRIFLYEKEIGVEVKTPAALRKAIKGQLDSPAAQKKMAAAAEKFAKENAHFLRDDNAKRVVDQIQKDLRRAKQA